MAKILVGIHDEHKIVQEGICSLLKDRDDIDVVMLSNSRSDLVHDLKVLDTSILIMNLHTLNNQLLNLITQITISHPQVKILIISALDKDELIVRSIRAGAKGFLARESSKNDLIQAIYTIQNGFDYYSNSITHILINKYINRLKTEDEYGDSGVKSLSSREIEVLKLWGSSFTNKEISEKLFISVRTVESHKNHIMQKLNLKTTVDMVKFAIKNNIIDL